MIGFGTKTDTLLHTIQYSIDCGYNLIDTKDSNESLKHFKKLCYNRDSVFLCSKLMSDNHSVDSVIKACEKSLMISGLEYWDLYYIHVVHSFNGVNILDTYGELIKLKMLDKIKNIGLSNVTCEQLQGFLYNEFVPDYVQIEIHPYLVESRIVELCKKNNIHIIAHSPLGSSLWKDIKNDKILIELASVYKTSVAGLILQWHKQRGVVCIPSSKQMCNIKSNYETNTFLISQSDIHLINSLNKNKRVYIKPNHYESIGRICKHLPQRYQNDFGFKTYKIEDIDASLKDVFKGINAVLENKDNNELKQERFNEYSFQNRETSALLDKIKNNTSLCNIVNDYMKIDYDVTCMIKISYPSSNLAPVGTSLFHRDTQVEKCLKMIIYLNEVNEMNGPLQIVYPENSLNSNLIWYKDRYNARTSLESVIQNYGENRVHSITGPAYTCILFEGSCLHAGGYVYKGRRECVYIEFVKR